MPGRHRQNGAAEPKLSRKQSALAGRVLKGLWAPERGVASDADKARILSEVNAAFAREGHPANYSERKLADAISNRMYTYRLSQREATPQSWQTGARAVRRKRTNEESFVKDEAEEESMVTPRGTANTVAEFACDAEIFGLPLMEHDVACNAVAPSDTTLPAAPHLEVAITVSSIDESWNVLAAMDGTDMDMLPSPPTSPMQSPTPRPVDSDLCGGGLDMSSFDLNNDSMCGTTEMMEPPQLDELDLLLERAQVDINLDGTEWAEVDYAVESSAQAEARAFLAANQPPVVDTQPEMRPNGAAPAYTASRDGDSTSAMENFAAMDTQKKAGRDSRTQSDLFEPRQKLRKIDSSPNMHKNGGLKEDATKNRSLLEAQTAAWSSHEAPRRALQNLSTINSQSQSMVPTTGSAPAA